MLNFLFVNEKQRSSFANFLYFSNPLTCLTNCALLLPAGELDHGPGGVGAGIVGEPPL